MSTKEIVTVDSLKIGLFKEQQKNLIHFLGDEEKSNKFLGAVVYCFQNSKLHECSKESIVSSFMKCAEYNLFPSSVSGEAYILPYKNRKTGSTEAQFQLGYKWIITLLARGGVRLYTDIIRENDEIEITSGFEQNIIHKYPAKSPRWKAVWVYAIAITSDGQKFIKYMYRDDVLAFKKFSQSATAKEEWQRDKSPWNEENDPELNMWRKTAIKQIAKNLPITEQIDRAINDDNSSAENNIEEYHERKMMEYATRPSEGKIADLLWVNKNETQSQPKAEIIEPEVVEIRPWVTKLVTMEDVENAASEYVAKKEDNIHTMATNYQIEVITWFVKQITGNKPYNEQNNFLKNLIKEKFGKNLEIFGIEEMIGALTINEASEIITILKSQIN